MNWLNNQILRKYKGISELQDRTIEITQYEKKEQID